MLFLCCVIVPTADETTLWLLQRGGLLQCTAHIPHRLPAIATNLQIHF